MNNNRKTIWTVVIIVVVLVLIGVWAWSANYGGSSYMAPTGNETTTSTTSDTTASNGAEVGTGTGEPAIAYATALQLYANKRIQFSTPVGENSCQAAPNTLTFKSGTKFMLDNRTNGTINIHLSSGVTYSLPAYSFQLIALVTPATYNVDCNFSQNVVKLQIQK